LEANSITLKEYKKVNNALNKTIEVVTKTVELLYQKAQGLQEKQQQLPTTNEGKMKTVGSLNSTAPSLCKQPDVVSTCKIEDVTVR
jgi:uncharacterized protein YoxC